MRLLKREWHWSLGLAVVIWLVWAVHYDRMAMRNWSPPIEYNGDSVMMLAMIKASGEGAYPPFLPRTVQNLGAPFAANWEDFPIPEGLVIFPIGFLAKWFNVGVAANAAVLLAHLLAGVVFYYCCRFLRFRREWALAGSLLFAFTYYNLWRGLAHLTNAYTFTVPLMLLNCWIIVGSQRLKWWDFRCWFCLLSALWFGLSNPYNLNVYCQLLLLSLLVMHWLRWRKVNRQVGAAAFAFVAAGFLLYNWPTLWLHHVQGANPEAMLRNYFQCELYALKPIELILPPPEHRSALLGGIGQYYANSSYLKGEIFSPYLGVVVIAAFAWMALEVVHWVVRRPRAPLATYGPYSLWILLYSTVGGVSALVGLAGFQLFRASNRYSIFLSALGLFFLVSRLARISRGWPAFWRISLAAGLTIIGMLDQITPTVRAGEGAKDTTTMRQAMESDRDFVMAMEQRLPPAAMVFQLPVMDYPLGGAVHKASDYEHFRPYLHAKTLRFSFGNIRGRPRDEWQRAAEKLPASQLVETLEKFGFAAIYICRLGFPDNGEDLLKQLAAAGRDQIIEDARKELVCVLLKPSPNPVLPDSASQTMVIYQAGWSATERLPAGVRRWTSGNAILQFHNPRAAGPHAIRCQLLSPNARQVAISVAGKEIWRGSLNPGQLTALDVVVVAKKGANTVELVTDTAPIQANPNNPVIIAFAVIDLKITSMANSAKP